MFLMQGFILCPLRELGCAWAALVGFTPLYYSSSFPNFDVVPRDLGEFDGVI